MKVKLEDVCKRIYAGGDVPKNRFSESKTKKYSVPIYANAEKNNGLYGYTDLAKEDELSITIAARGTIGFVAIRTEPFLPVVRLITLVPNLSKISARYLYYVLRNLKPKCSGTSIPQLTVPDIKKNGIKLYAISKQEEIADQLEILDNIIKIRSQEIKKLEDLIKARFVEMFVDKGYPVKTIGDVIDKKITRVAKAFDKMDEIQYLDISSIDSSSKKVKKLTRYILAEAPSRAQYVLKYNDIMYSTVRPNLQNVAINTCSEENVVGSTGFCILRCIGVTVGYMWGVINSISFTEAMTNQATGASYPAVTDKVVYSYKIPIPPKEEQIVYEQLVRQTDKSKIAEYINYLYTFRRHGIYSSRHARAILMCLTLLNSFNLMKSFTMFIFSWLKFVKKRGTSIYL